MLPSINASFATEEAFDQLRGKPANIESPAIYGLFTFARIVTEIQKTASIDELRATKYIEITKRALKKTTLKLAKLEAKISEKHSEIEHLAESFEVKTSPPKSVRLNFSSPLSYEAATLLMLADKQLHQVNLCVAFSAFTFSEAKQLKRDIQKCIRGLFHSVSSFNPKKQHLV